MYGTSWDDIGRRLGETDHESMIGSTELKFTSEILLEDSPHFLTSTRDVVNNPITETFTTKHSEMHSEEEIIRLIQLGI